MNDVRRHTAPEDTKTTIRMPGPGDAAAIMSIDRDGLGTSHASFRENPHDWSSFQATFAGERGLALVAEAASVVVGWAGISPTSTRSVYRGVGEVSIYVARGIQGKGVGRVLLEAIISRSEEAGYWTLIAQIFPENEASIALHRRCGFRELGRRGRLGRMTYGPLKNRWRDVIFLERRSGVAGLE